MGSEQSPCGREDFGALVEADETSLEISPISLYL